MTLITGGPIKKRIFWERLSPQTRQTIIDSYGAIFKNNQSYEVFLSAWCKTQNIKYFRIWHSRESRFMNVLEFDTLDQYVEFCLKHY